MKNILDFKLIEGFIKSNKLTIKTFCKSCKISTNSYYKIQKTTDFGINILFKIAKGINVDVYRLFLK